MDLIEKGNLMWKDIYKEILRGFLSKIPDLRGIGPVLDSDPGSRMTDAGQFNQNNTPYLIK